MKVIRKNVAAFLVILLTIVSCNKEAQNSKIETGLDNNLEIENMNQKRKFNPNLDNKWIGNAISYGPYRAGQAPGANGPDKTQIKQDLELISQKWNLIRVYNSDDDTRLVLETIRENNFPIRVMLGVWLENESDPNKLKQNITNVENAIQLANEYKNEVIAVSVGNETQVYWSAHRMSIEHLITHIQKVRESIVQPITSADDYAFWLDDSSKVLASELDFITTHAHPAWNGLQLDNSVPWLDSIYKEVKAKHTDNEIIIGETGWPTNFARDQIGDGLQGTLIKGEISSQAQQRFFEAYNNLINQNKITSFIFEAFDEPWKGGGSATGDDEVEKHWGLYYENRTPKFHN